MLEGAHFSKPFREFVSLCLQRDPLARPSARELLKHRFIKSAKKTGYLVELIDRLERWRAEGGGDSSKGDGDRKGDQDDECVVPQGGNSILSNAGRLTRTRANGLSSLV